ARSFLQEAAACCDSGLNRAAVVFSWVGAIALLQEHVVAEGLAEFNAEALRRDPKWRTARTQDDLGRMKENEFLEILEALSIVGKIVKQALQTALTLRNAFCHPNSLKVGPNMVAGHLEVLTLNVFSRF